MITNKTKQRQLKKQKKLSQPPTDLTFLEHFYELRKRLFWVVLTIVVASAAGFQYKDQLISVVMQPLHGEKLIYLTPAGGFSFIFTLSLYFGVLLSIPVVIYHIYRFLQPLFVKSSRRLVVTLILLSTLLASAGTAFGYFVTIPAAINFLSNFAGDAVTASLTAESYLNFVVAYVLGLAALFQLPLLLFIFDHVRPIPPGMLSSTQRFVIIAATILAAIITPTPDAINMAIVAIPIIFVYELGAFAVFIRHRLERSRRRKAHEATEKQTPQEVPAPKMKVPAVAVATPIVAAVKAPQPLRHSKTIDGVVRTAPTLMQVPSRPGTMSSRIADQRPHGPRPLRSIDGLSMV